MFIFEDSKSKDSIVLRDQYFINDIRLNIEKINEDNEDKEKKLVYLDDKIHFLKKKIFFLDRRVDYLNSKLISLKRDMSCKIEILQKKFKKKHKILFFFMIGLFIFIGFMIYYRIIQLSESI